MKKTTAQKTQESSAPLPSPPPDIDALPHPLTIVVSSRDRKRILAALRRINTDRAAALLTALGLQAGGDA